MTTDALGTIYRGTSAAPAASSAATPDVITAAVASGESFWLDLDVAGEAGAAVASLLTDTFHFHPLAVSATTAFGQRARIDGYGDFTHIVTFGMSGDGPGVNEVHCYVTAHSVITVHDGPCAALASVPDRLAVTTFAAAPEVTYLYVILDTLVDSFFPALSSLDDAIDELASEILKTPTEEQLGRIFAMKRQVMTIRRAVVPQRDMISAVNAGVVALPGFTEDGRIYFRNLYDHLIRIGDMVDGYRDLLSGVMDTHLSMVSNRLNLVMKQLAVIATVFLPLGFLTGFFGQNFSWLQSHTQATGWEFLGWGLGLEVVAIVILGVVFKRRGWLGEGPTA